MVESGKAELWLLLLVSGLIVLLLPLAVLAGLVLIWGGDSATVWLFEKLLKLW